MALLDQYRGKGQILVSSLTPAERKELRVLIARGSDVYLPYGLTLGRTLARVEPSQALPGPGPSGGNIVAFRLDEPRVKEEQKPMPREKVRIYAPVHSIPRLTPTQREEQVKRYAEEMARHGVDFAKLQAPPILPEITDQVTWLRWVLTRQRKAAMVDESNAAQARQWGLVAFRTPHGAFTGPVAKNRAYIIYHPGNAAAAKEVVRVLNKYPIGKRGPDYMREMGAVLGTPPSDTEKAIRAFYGEGKGKGKAPQWLGVLSLGVLIVFLFAWKSETV